MMNSGWGEKYNNAQLVFGTDNLSNSSTFNFPGFSLDACKFLLTQRQVITKFVYLIKRFG